MNIAIMQPYFFPYIGYYQLIKETDVFVFLDNVNFRKGSWINRNFILSGNKKVMIRLPLINQSQNRFISEHFIFEKEKSIQVIKKTLMHAYSKAPNYAWLEKTCNNALSSDQNCLSKYLAHTIIETCKSLNIDSNFLFSSELDLDKSLKKENLLIEITKSLGGNSYTNLPGGKNLYSKERFAEKNIELNFIEPNIFNYPQDSDHFIPNLSILDLLARNNAREITNRI